MKIIAQKKFSGEIFRVTMYDSQSIGEHESVMTLMKVDNDFYTHVIEWYYDIEDGVEIGLKIENNKVIDYDGVFELNAEAIELLEENGFDTAEVRA